ncbi:hypothetical protein JG687_00015781 [Phytophthora cactorum]|uniref:Uncharacterized protein n=1 Tax=Phytophthora cactorum TaxID=29920 RepID=A0A8T1TVZ4_9STRA|nr:hypothetical protein JG687_00015781 [Phytophthora cactorum]
MDVVLNTTTSTMQNLVNCYAIHDDSAVRTRLQPLRCLLTTNTVQAILDGELACAADRFAINDVHRSRADADTPGITTTKPVARHPPKY